MELCSKKNETRSIKGGFAFLLPKTILQRTVLKSPGMMSIIFYRYTIARVICEFKYFFGCLSDSMWEGMRGPHPNPLPKGREPVG